MFKNVRFNDIQGDVNALYVKFGLCTKCDIEVQSFGEYVFQKNQLQYIKILLVYYSQIRNQMGVHWNN